jgi:predicted nucleic acid-binding protein
LLGRPECRGLGGSVAPAETFLTAITNSKLEQGILGIERRAKAQDAILRRWLEQWIIPGFAGRVLPLDIAVARCCAQLYIPDQRGKRDAMIAATDMVHGVVVTRNARDFV